ncbi:MAG: undecaprenyl-phosphate glucose phosphotransferase [Candidatus Scalindua sp.]
MLVFFFRLSDASIIVLTLLGALSLRGISPTDKHFLPALAAIIFFSFIGRGLSVYGSLRGVPFTQLVWSVLISWGATVFILFAAGYFLKTLTGYSRIVIGIWIVTTPLLLLLLRLIVRVGLSYYRSKGHNSRLVAIVGAGDAGNRIGQVINKTPSFGLKVKGYFDNRKSAGNRIAKDLIAPMLGDIDDLVYRAKSDEFDLIYIALALKAQEHIAKLIAALADTNVSVHLVPDFFVFDLLHSRWRTLGTVPTLSVYESPFMGVDGWLKRAEDFLMSSLILAFIAIPMLIIAAGVKYSSPGPVLFKQRRWGTDGKPIKVWKFRSMTVCDDGDKVMQAKKGDVRITPFGAFLRRTSLDELPQFINVLTGEMSIVGPRPHAVAHNEEYRKLIFGYMLRHKVKPGITGWAQINGWRGETDTLDKMEIRVEHDLNYIRNWSLWWDLKIVFRTLLTGFVGKNAY